jgi:hypothetical protein
MALKQAVRQLQNEQNRLQAELNGVTAALKALDGLGGNGRRRGMGANGRRRARRKMSAAGRRAISRAQRARWAKLKR